MTGTMRTCAGTSPAASAACRRAPGHRVPSATVCPARHVVQTSKETVIPLSLAKLVERAGQKAARSAMERACLPAAEHPVRPFIRQRWQVSRLAEFGFPQQSLHLPSFWPVAWSDHSGHGRGGGSDSGAPLARGPPYRIPSSPVIDRNQRCFTCGTIHFLVKQQNVQ